MQDAMQARKMQTESRIQKSCLQVHERGTRDACWDVLTCHVSAYKTEHGIDSASSHILTCQLVSARYVSSRSRSRTLSTCLSRELVPCSTLTLGIPVASYHIFVCWIVWGHATGGAVGWGTALQGGMSWVRFPMASLEFFMDIILPAALWPWGRFSL